MKEMEAAESNEVIYYTWKNFDGESIGESLFIHQDFPLQY